MAKVSLRIYNREIESLIDQNHLDEAIAHCHHILQTFPKHLETYRLLGKAYLESKQYTEAVDIFNRVLVAVPDDFVSHVGMSIIRDDEGKLDDAIWHMERAFESQPSNSAIQSEMQRLYGRRDGVEPPKIRMTRGALAHMYFQGELYPQAISEIRAVLGQDPQRADMQVLLARAYFQGGQKADASDLCSQLLKRYPYCFDANRIMVELLPATDRAENTQVYRHRVNELDPYALFAKESLFRSNEVPDASVNLERLEYSGESVEMAQDWGTSLGIGLTSGSSVSSEQPDWLKAGLSESHPEPSFDAGPTFNPPSEAVPTSSSESDIPDFLRQAGWTESRDRAEEPTFSDSSPAGDLTPANIPDWLKNQMPPEAERPPKQPVSSQPVSSGDMPDWLSGLGSSESTEAAPGDIPDWLQDLGQEQPEQQAAQPELEPKDESDLTPDWLSSLSGTESKQSEPAIDAEPPKVAPRAATIETLGTTEKEQDDAVAWLEMLAAKHGAKPEELVTDPNARKETPPEWVEQARSIAESKLEEQPVTPEAGEDETGMWLRDLSEKETPSPVSEDIKQSVPDQELPEWLRGLESQTSEEQLASEPVAQEPQPASDVPDWLTEIQSKSDVQPEMESLAEEKSDIPYWLSGLQDESISEKDLTVTGAPEKQDVADWLSGLDQEPRAEQAVSEPKTEPIPQPRADVPEWLRGLESSSVTGMEEQAEKLSEEPAIPSLSETEEPVSVSPAATELPEWLRGIDEKQPEEELPEVPTPTSPLQPEEPAPVAPTAAELPEWLRGVDETQPEEELPAEPAASSIPQTEEPASVSPAAAELPEWLRGIDEKQPEEELPGEPPISAIPEAEEPTPISSVAAEITEWTREVDITQPGEDLQEETTASALPQTEEPAPSTDAEMPEWLRGVEEAQPEEKLPEQPSISPIPEAEEAAPVPSAAAELPDWLRGIDETEPEKSSEEARENLPAWLQSELEEEEPRPAPTASADWHPAEPQPESPAQEPEPEFDVSQPPVSKTMQPAIDLGQPEPPSPNVYEPAPRPPTPVQKPSRPARVRQVETPQASAEMVKQAKEELNRGDLPTAVNHYTKLIKKGKHLDETIRDLRESLYRYPVEVSIWQTLGDAYMRANRLQDALDAYNKAEELIR